MAAVRGAVLSDRGQVREINEDAVHLELASSPEARTRGVLCVLADGMGGYAAGEVASSLAVQAIRNRYYTSASGEPVAALRIAVEAANQEIWTEAQRQAERSGMGCTATAALVLGDRLVVGHVGDSRAYLIRGDGIARITEDHSWVAQQVASGALTEEQADHHPRRNVILRALGARKDVEVAMYSETLRPGDVVVLCSDGLSTTVSDGEIGRIVQDCPPQQAVRRLVSLANERGAPDNVTVAVLRVPAPVDSWLARLHQWGPLIAAVGVLLALALVIGVTTSGGHAGEDLSAEPTIVSIPSPDAPTPSAVSSGTRTTSTALSGGQRDN